MATNTAASFSTPTANGTAGPFNIGFNYLAQSEIDVTVDGVLKTLGTHYTFHSTTQISFTSGNFPTSGQAIRFQRDTDISAKKVDFINGSVLTETDLDNNSDQVLFGLQEFVDELNTNVVKRDGTQTITNNLVFEGSSDDANETTLGVVNPTADRTINLPNVSGTVVTTGDTGTVSNGMIADDAVNAAKISDADLKSLSSCQTGSAASIANLTNNEVSILDGATVSTTELNTLDGVNSTLTASELNTLDGITASTANLNQLTNKEVETSITANSDAKIPTSKAVNDRILTVTNALGGFVAIANETSFPSTHPDPSSNAGTVVSISDAGGVVVNSSGVASISNGAGSSTVTINGFPSDLQSKTLGSGVGLQVQTTTTLHTYTYHKVLLKESDLINLSNDIDDFGNRYRVVDTTPSSNNDEGDLIFRKSDNKLLVFNGTAYQEASSVGNFHTNTLSSYNGTGGNTATFNGSAYRFNIDHPPELAEQLLVSINGVVQKPNSGTSQPSEGFAISGSSVIFSAAPASGSDFFIITIGKSVDIGTPSDNTVTTAKLVNTSVSTEKIQDNAITSAKIVDGAIVNADINASAAIDVSKLSGVLPLAGGAVTGNLDLGDSNKIRLGDSQDLQIYHISSQGSIINHFGANHLVLRSGNNIDLRSANDDSYFAKFVEDGAAEIYFDGSKKLETNVDGVQVTGSTGAFLEIRSSGAYDAGLVLTANNNNNTDWSIRNDESASNLLDFRFNGTHKASLDSSGGLSVTGNITVSGTVDGVDIAALNTTVSGKLSNIVEDTSPQLGGALDTNNQNIEFGDVGNLTQNRLRFGASNDLSIFHDAGSSTNFISTVGNNSCSITSERTDFKNGSNNETFGSFIANSAVELYFDNSKKFETTSTGITVTGAITGTADATINSVNIGKGANSVANNTVLGEGALDAAVTGNHNVAIGKSALGANTSGFSNVAVGRLALPNNTTGDSNLAVGTNALMSNTTASNNTAVGTAALSLNTTGFYNTAVGAYALDANTTGVRNHAFGAGALGANTTASDNTGIGYFALFANITGTKNTAVGSNALDAVTTSSSNTAIGYQALTTHTGNNCTAVGSEALKLNTGERCNAFGSVCLDANTTGADNNAFGVGALGTNTTGQNNVAFGTSASALQTTASNNSAFGKGALQNNTAANNTAVGYNSLNLNTTGTSNIAVGAYALDANTTAHNNTAVGKDSLGANTTGGSNVAVGQSALGLNTTANSNTAVGSNALEKTTTASNNTAVGRSSLKENTTGTRNVAVGAYTLDANTTASNNTGLGYGALSSNTTGSTNTAVGDHSMVANTTGTANTAVGQAALEANTTGGSNTAVGADALTANTTGTRNTAVGASALQTITTANDSTAVGFEALKLATGTGNTAVGRDAGKAITSGGQNTILGTAALDALSTGERNTAVGGAALSTATTSNDNTAVGYAALLLNTTGTSNTAVGINALDANTTGNDNTVVGGNALSNITTGYSNVAVGNSAGNASGNTNGLFNVYIGKSAGSSSTASGGVFIGNVAGSNSTTGNQVICIGHESQPSSATASHEITLGSSSISGLRCNVQTISSLSDARDKTNVIDLPEGLDFVTKLRPVKFEWATRDGNGKDGSFEHGFIAQDLQAAQKENDADYLNMVMDENPDRLEASYGKLVPILVKAIQELTMEVNKLKSNG